MPEGASADANPAGQAAKLKAILESALDAIITIDSAGTMTTANRAAEILFGYSAEELIGQNVRFLMPEPYHSQHDQYIRNYLDTGTRKIIGSGREVSGRRRDGSVFPMHLAVSEFHIEGRRYFTGIIHDLSHSKATERALREAQKMEALGQLTGGIAHDFNNLLTVIVGNMEMLQSRLSDEDQRLLAREVLEATEAGARLTSRLLAFARRSHLEPEVIDMNQFVLAMTSMLHRTLGESIHLSTVLDPQLWPVKVDPSQVESAIVNLAVNARDAMPKGGRLVLETANVALDGEAVDDFGDLAPGDYVCLSVSDTGQGMPASVRQHAFEPFFTTKPLGHGTGLGLSMVYGFAKQSEGHATIFSERNRGTTIHLYLPRNQGLARYGTGSRNTEVLSGNRERILVVEDDERVRRLTIERLRRLNYRVVEAADAPTALDILQRDPSVELVFSDLVMPGPMDGQELAEWIMTHHPDIRVLLTSGYSADVLSVPTEKLRLLRKPYGQADLAKAITAALG